MSERPVVQPGHAEAMARAFDRPIFLAGRGRSGTSLLARLFDGHPEVWSAPGETLVFTEIAPRMRETGDRAAAAAALAQRFPAPSRDVDAALTAAVAGLDLADPALPRRLLEIGMARWGRQHPPGPAVAFLEKTPKNEDHLPALFAAFPTARVLYLLRDPRAVHVSNARSETYRMEPAFVAHQWLKSVRRILAYVGREDAASAIRVVRFEDLVADPEGTMRSLCAFLGLAWSDALLAPTVRGRPWEGNSYDPAKLTPDGVAARKADEWRDEISAGSKAAIEDAAGFEMSLLGYRT